MQHSSDESQIRTLVEDWQKAIRSGDLEAVLASHTDDVVLFDVPPPLQNRGIGDYKKAWELYFSYKPEGDEDSFKLLDLELFVGDTVAYGHSPLRVAGGTARLSLGFRKINDKWYIAHEHHSFPAE